MSETIPIPVKLRRLCVVLGDQLDHGSVIFDGFDPAQDALLITEAAEEASYIAQHKKRLVLFFSAMRHFAEDQRAEGRPVIYRRLDDPEPAESLADSLRRAVGAHSPDEILLVKPGDWRVLDALRGASAELDTPLRVCADTHFLTTDQEFHEWFDGRKRVVLEDFYRVGRKRTGWLMDEGQPEGGAWNFDKDNRKSFGKQGPGLLPGRADFEPDALTAEVIKMVGARFSNAPGKLDGFQEPVSRQNALRALDDFITHRLPQFGDYQDAMATGELTLYHSRISAVMNLKLLRPEECCLAAIEALREGRAPLNAVEGFIRQILGWREFIRGVYWALMPEYAERNHLEAGADVPGFFWTGETEMACLADGVGGLVETGYAHHIQRLMVMGLFLMLYGARPYAVHQWHIAMYLDAIDWVSLPNVLGMSQHGDGGVVGTKPYSASGAYIDRMSDSCARCPHDPKQATGSKACPFTTLYWDFLDRHEDRFKGNMRMKMQLNNLVRKSDDDRRAIRGAAEKLKARLA
ncbi:MAG: cryptochrome/photolyase family protein [Pseudomonadota bacterium]